VPGSGWAGASLPPEIDTAGPAELSPRSRAAVIHRIRSLMEFWSITPEDLEAWDPAATPPRPSAAPTVKYRHPGTGDTWNGEGAHPQWLRDALLKEGFTVEQLRATIAPS
jgi:DNA-binding protein H-NS